MLVVTFPTMILSSLFIESKKQFFSTLEYRTYYIIYFRENNIGFFNQLCYPFMHSVEFGIISWVAYTPYKCFITLSIRTVAFIKDLIVAKSVKVAEGKTTF